MRNFLFIFCLFSLATRAQSLAKLRYLPTPSLSSTLDLPVQELSRSGENYDFIRPNATWSWMS